MKFDENNTEYNLSKLDEETYENKIYAIDCNIDRSVMIFGGIKNILWIKHSQTEDITAFEKYSDSVIFCKFVDKNTFLVAILNGEIYKYTLNRDIIEDKSFYNLNNDISFIEISSSDTEILIGTITGAIHVLSIDLLAEHVYLGHKDEIVSIQKYDDKLYSLSDSYFIIFNASTYKSLMHKQINQGYSMSVLGNRSICLCDASGIQIFRDNTTLFNIRDTGRTESIALSDNLTIVGTDQNIFFIFYNTTFSYFTVNVGVNKLSIISDYLIASSTNSEILVFSLSDIQSYKVYKTDVDIIYDFVVFGNEVLIAGDSGISAIEIDF
ncbi:WD40-like domain-containing protein [Hamiltosporidium magnivora]|uniref:WD40-like domain-containing protein n=1 Tax=Hamiltosporidium magnivora TaxID=148818 RepID=A0A4Q9KY36_9MICR|nr:WD40-like domain-containing protein [Hamiltosporidium magnivora]